jgi:hypothetical protein
MIKSILRKYKNNVIHLLQFLVYSKRLLKLAKAKEVIAMQIKNELEGFNIKHQLFCETNILDYCPGLVTVIHSTDKELYLTYFSVKEYLLKISNFRITTTSISIIRTCLTYLTDINKSNRGIE